ncbi:PilZ domain-containing protein [Myxococcota bacterium]|nr:PilZ domain-containing protein [Myxococcota bacterium]MBU1379363.1 PilZ domain-containing protein [Myxococcota bacterium]MBU1497033.1 PilZ domain-containing protein [Myxococcota bacterium]
MSNEDYLNRRSSERFNLKMEIDLRCPDSGLFSHVTTNDLSLGGVCFQLDKRIDLDRNLELGLSLILGPDAMSEIVYVAGKVVWCAEEFPGVFQIGAAFTNLDDEKKVNLDTFLEFIRQGIDIQQISGDADDN